LTRRIVSLVVALVALGACVRNNTTHRRRQAERKLEELVHGETRFVDMGALLRVVRMDLERGAELVPGSPPLVVVDEIPFGGMVDTAPASPFFCGPSRAPAIWYCSEEAAPLILHGDELPDRLLVYGSEGSGKTTAQAIWAGLRFLEFTGEDREIGITAPTAPRLDHVFQAINRLWPASWYRWNTEEGCFYGVNGVRVRLVSTHQQSKAEGSRVQGYNWSAHGGDEMQDQTEYDADIEMRGRTAPRGRYKRFNTCTAKDAPKWREYRDRVLSKPKRWAKRDLIGPRQPFIWPSVWEDRKDTLTLREYQRRVLAMDVGPERMTYHTWSRDENLRRIPPGAVDITAEVMAPWGRGISLLGGHDPGTLFDVTILLKAFRLRGVALPQWWVVGEVTTEQSTTETHVQELLREVRGSWDVTQRDVRGRPVEDGPTLLVRADPYSDSGAGDKSPDKSVYTVFKKHGVRILPAAHIASVDKTLVGRVPKEGRIDMVTTLLCAASGERRLFVDCDDARAPVAPRLVEAIETSERDEIGKAEMQRKDKRDMSHWPAALGYGLWQIERPRLEKGRAA
jgi:hypothetical protein